MAMPQVSCLGQRTRRGRTWFSMSASIAALPRPAHGGNFLWDLLICCRRNCFSATLSLVGADIDLCGTGTLLPIHAQKRRENGALPVAEWNLRDGGTDRSVCAT